MKIGKVSETVLKRSVFKELRYRRDEVLLGAGVGEDCAAVKLAPGEVFVISTDPITGTAKDMGKLAIQITANDLASSGAEPLGVMVTILLPPRVSEAKLRAMMQQMEAACQTCGMQVMGGHTEVTAAVNQPIITVTGVGKVKEGALISTAGARPGDDIVLTKWIGIEGTSIIAKEKEEQLLTRLPKGLIDTAKGFDQYLSVLPEAKIAAAMGATAMHDVTEGGVYGALWEVAEASDTGVEADLKAIPIRQETVEICEFFNLNPYYLISSGCMLITIAHGHDLVKALGEAGIPAAVVGKITGEKQRVVRLAGEAAYLERPKTDELYKIYEEKELQ